MAQQGESKKKQTKEEEETQDSPYTCEDGSECIRGCCGSVRMRVGKLDGGGCKR